MQQSCQSRYLWRDPIPPYEPVALGRPASKAQFFQLISYSVTCLGSDYRNCILVSAARLFRRPLTRAQPRLRSQNADLVARFVAVPIALLINVNMTRVASGRISLYADRHALEQGSAVPRLVHARRDNMEKFWSGEFGSYRALAPDAVVTFCS